MKNIKIIFVLLAFIVSAGITEKGFTMSMLFPSKVVPFSGFEGTLTDRGEPLADVKIRRIYNFKGADIEDIALTDSEGRFSFPTVWESSRAPFFAQFSSEQELLVTIDGKEKSIWYGVKLMEEEYGEFGGKPENLVCKLDDETRVVKQMVGFFKTNCYWD